jgi:hypothetical protein
MIIIVDFIGIAIIIKILNVLFLGESVDKFMLEIL